MINSVATFVIAVAMSGSLRNFVFLSRGEVHGFGCGRKEHHVHDRERWLAVVR